MSSAVKVAVRVRPFNDREKAANSSCIISMRGPSTTLESVNGAKPITFTFDYSYWSHNTADAHYADNNLVFNDLGVLVLDNAFEGYNTSLFAYGQTGSGKSYSMVGYGDDKGIIPKVCDTIFQRIEANKTAGSVIIYQVECTMMEIYNEEVRDLFNPTKNPAGGLKVRDHPKTGPYVEGLTPILVNSYAEVDKLMAKGTAARTIAATNMNQTSSRAHTIFSIIFTQTTVNETNGTKHDRVSRINLVDLAGSEKLGATGATGQTMKEGIGINLSLTSLGNVISALADKASGKANVFIPYRNSVLTFIMKESLGGNSKTIMIAAISPASINYDESLSTLRYADRAKKIQNTAIVNEDPNVKLIKDLKLEIEKLKEQLAGSGSSSATSPTSTVSDEEMKRLQLSLEQSQKLISELNMTVEEREKRTLELEKERDEALSRYGIAPSSVDTLNRMKHIHMVNLNEDPQMSEQLIYGIFKESTTVGAATSEGERPDIPLSGLGIGKIHATLTITNHQHYQQEKDNKGVQLFVTPTKPDFSVYINGALITAKSELKHGDRVVFGMNHFFRVAIPDPSNLEDTPQQIDWRMAVEELANKLAEEKAIKIRTIEKQHEEEEQKKKLKEFEEQMALQKSQMEKDFQKEKEAVLQREQELKNKISQLANEDTATKLRAENELKMVQAKMDEISARMMKTAEELKLQELSFKKKLEEEHTKYQELQQQKLQLEKEQEQKILEFQKQIAEQKNEMEQKLQREREMVKLKEEELAKKQAELSSKMSDTEKKKLEEQMKQLADELEAAKAREASKVDKYAQREQQHLMELEQEKKKLESVVSKSVGILNINEVFVRLIPLINEANFISCEMNVDTDFEIKFDPVTQAISILVRNEAVNWGTEWPEEQFITRVQRMREVYELWKSDPLFELNEHNDPFFDRAAAEKAGKSYVPPQRKNVQSPLFPPTTNAGGPAFQYYVNPSDSTQPFDPFALPFQQYENQNWNYGQQQQQQQSSDCAIQVEHLIAENAQLTEENTRLKIELEEMRQKKLAMVTRAKERKKARKETKRLRYEKKGKLYISSDSSSDDDDDFDGQLRTQKKKLKKERKLHQFPVTHAEYYIVSKTSGQVLDADVNTISQISKEHPRVFMNTLNESSPSQKWVFEKQSKQTFAIKTKYLTPHLCLDGYTNVLQHNDSYPVPFLFQASNGESQSWKLEPTGTPGEFVIICAQNQLALDSNVGATTHPDPNFKSPFLWPATPSASNHQWLLKIAGLTVREKKKSSKKDKKDKKEKKKDDKDEKEDKDKKKEKKKKDDDKADDGKKEKKKDDEKGDKKKKQEEQSEVSLTCNSESRVCVIQ